MTADTTRTSINPPDDPAHAKFNFDEAQLHSGFSRLLVTSGQVGRSTGDMAEQMADALNHIGELLDLSGMDRAAIARLGIYTTDVDAFLANWTVMLDWFAPVGVVPPNTVMQVVRFLNPRALIEIEALAVA